jgi:hypothetical protein
MAGSRTAWAGFNQIGGEEGCPSHRVACRMVKAARDAWFSGALTQHSNRLSTKAILAVGKRRPGLTGSFAFAQQHRQLGDIHRTPPVRGSARCSAFHPTDPALKPNLHQHRSPPLGNAILRGRDKGPERALEIQSVDCRDKWVHECPPVRGYSH